MPQRRLSLMVTPALAGKEVDTLLRRELFLSGTAVKHAKAQRDGILLDGIPVFTNTLVREEQLLSVLVSDTVPMVGIVPISGPLLIRYEDEDLLIVDKPAGVTVHPGPGHYDDTLANFLAQYYLDHGIEAGYHPVNRLDRGTSGLMVVAKHAHAHALLREQLHSGTFCRSYLAVCDGVPPSADGVVDLPIGRMPGSVIKREIRPDGSAALTRYWVLETTGDHSLLFLTLATGRTHQIRVHMAYLGCPVTGDFLYGREHPALPGRFALHSAAISLHQPITGAEIQTDSPLPPGLRGLLAY